MADQDFTDFSSITANTMALADKLVGCLGDNSAEFAISLSELQLAVNQFVQQRGNRDALFFEMFGQSWLEHGTAPSDAGTIAANSRVHSYQFTNPGHAWGSGVDLTATVLTDEGNPFTGFDLGGFAQILWKFGDLFQTATGLEVLLHQTGYSASSIALWTYTYNAATAMEQFRDSHNAAVADSFFTSRRTSTKADAVLMALGWTDVSGAATPGLTAEKLLRIRRDAIYQMGWGYEEQPWICMDMPRSAEFEDFAAWPAIRLFSDIAGPYVRTVSIDNLRPWDNVHLTGDDTNRLAAMMFLEVLGLTPGRATESGIRYRRAVASLDEAYTKVTASAGAPVGWTGGEFNFDVNTAAPTKLRLHYESGDTNNIPFDSLGEWDVIRAEDTATGAVYIECILDAPGVWDAGLNTTPTYIEFDIKSVFDEASWPPADSTACQIKLKKSNLSIPPTTREVEYYTGAEGDFLVDGSLVVDGNVSAVDVTATGEISSPEFNVYLGTFFNFLKNITFNIVNGGINHTTSLITFYGSVITNQVITLFRGAKTVDAAPNSVTYGAQDALPTASTNVTGGKVTVRSGDGATSGAGGDGGDLELVPGVGGGSGGVNGSLLLTDLPIGELACVDGTTAEATVDTTKRILTCWTAINHEKHVDITLSNNYIEVTEPGLYLVQFQASFTGSNTTVHAFEIYAYFSSIPVWFPTARRCERYIGTGSDVGSASIFSVISLPTAGDRIAIYQYADGASKTLTVEQAQLTVARISN